ncbi:MAG: shikimate kinase [Paracoccaceae bacterium]
MMGSGKTAVGTALARLLDAPFLDSDAEIERAANASIAEIFRRDGEAFFREKETQVIERLLKEQRCVLATGGGAYLAAVNRDNINKNGVAVWLRADLDLLWSRVRRKPTRPLLQTDRPRAMLARLCREREASYGSAGLIVDAQRNYSIDEMADKVVAALLTRPDVLERA